MSNQKWSGKTEGWGFGIKIFLALIKIFGFAPAYVLLVPVCFVYTIISSKARIAIKQFRQHLNLKTNFFDYYAHFFSFSLSLIHKMGMLVGKNCKIKYIVENEDCIKNALQKGKGAILLSSHIGSWGIASEILFKRIGTKVNILTFERDEGKIKKIYEDMNKNRNVNIILLSENSFDTAMKIKDALQNGEIVAVLADRYIDENVAEIEFLGEKAKFPRGIFEIACITQTPIIPVFITRQKMEVYNFRVGEIIEMPNIDRKKRKEFIADLFVVF
jgi:predicted LPLAT superfamily acyltransferase